METEQSGEQYRRRFVLVYMEGNGWKGVFDWVSFYLPNAINAIPFIHTCSVMPRYASYLSVDLIKGPGIRETASPYIVHHTLSLYLIFTR